MRRTAHARSLTTSAFYLILVAVLLLARLLRGAQGLHGPRRPATAFAWPPAARGAAHSCGTRGRSARC